MQIRTPPSEGPDVLLARLVDGGGDPAWSDFVTTCYGGIYRTAYQIIGDHHAAEDAAQETLIRIAGAIDEYRPHPTGGAAAAQAWILRIAHNRAVDHARQLIALRRRQQSGADADAAAPAPAAGGDDLAELRQALAELPERHRHPLVLRFLQGMSYADIARGLNCAEVLARKKVQRALELLRQRVGGAIGAGAGVLVLPVPLPTAPPTLGWEAARTAASALPATGSGTLATAAVMTAVIGVAAVAWLVVAWSSTSAPAVPAAPMATPALAVADPAPTTSGSLLVDDHEHGLRWRAARGLDVRLVTTHGGHALRIHRDPARQEPIYGFAVHGLQLPAAVQQVRLRLRVEQADPNATLALHLGERDGEYWLLMLTPLTASDGWRTLTVPVTTLADHIPSGAEVDRRCDISAVTHLHLVMNGRSTVLIDDLQFDLAP